MLQHPIVSIMLPNIGEFLSHHPLEGTDDASIAEWRRGCEVSWNALCEDILTDEELSYASSILGTMLSAYSDLARLVANKKHSSANTWTLLERKASLNRLLNTPQIEQRTEAWYLDAVGSLSASQFNGILKPGRTRGLIVLQKASTIPPDPNQRRTCVSTSDLNPFTWGIRFEPIVKQIYEHLTKTKVAELGRLRHREDKRLAASPDGVVVEGSDFKLSRFVEFKAPVTRKILSIVPDDYMAQMQIQMEVGEVEECDYLEVKFLSKYGSKDFSVSSEDMAKVKYYGNIFLAADIESQEPKRYVYSPLNDANWRPSLELNEILLETIPWYCGEWYLTTVGRSRNWFESVKPAIQLFWEDVEKAKNGEFQLPASNRKSKSPACMILEDKTPPPEMAV